MNKPKLKPPANDDLRFCVNCGAPSAVIKLANERKLENVGLCELHYARSLGKEPPAQERVNGLLPT